MKFLLTAVNAKYIHSNPAVYSLRAFAGAGLQEHVEIAEYTINNREEEILADIYMRRPDVIGFSCYIWNWNMIQDIMTRLHKILPQLPIWLGGPEVTYGAPQILERYPYVTGIMVGEGEATFRELLTYYVQREMASEHSRQTAGESYAESAGAISGKIFGDRGAAGFWPNIQGLERIPGLCLSAGYTPVRELTDLSELPFLYEDLDPFANKIIYYESSRGCPYSCSYCLSSIDKRVRLRDRAVVKKELQFFLDHKAAQVKFVDRTFNCNHDHAMEIWSYILEHDNGVTNFHFEISADILREDEIEVLHRMRPGLVQLEIGVQSANPRTIDAIHRVMDLDKLERIVASIHEGHNIHQHLDLIAGLPYEDYESFGRSFNRVYDMSPQQLQLGFLKVLKGSHMARQAEQFGICYLENPPYEVLYTDWLSYEDVLRLKKVEQMVELYYNSGQFRHTLPFLKRAFQTPFAMFEALAAYYEQEGYFINSPARSYRYHVLLKFARKYDEPNAAVYQELLTYDMYLRENLKSRPDFAPDLTPFKEEIRSLYRLEEQCRELLPDYDEYDYKQLSKMTHMEPFRYPVQDMVKWEHSPLTNAGRNIPECFILFDYKHRNPLNCEARTVVVCRK